LTSAESGTSTTASPVGHNSLTSAKSGTSPAGGPAALIAGVQVLEWPQRYNYYQRFCSDAERFFAVRGTECPAEGYFSYIPQYAQLNHAQLRYYLWFRENARAETYLDDVDLPYILLYIYEIINLPHRIPADKGADQLAGLWLHYRLRRPELDRYLPEWMCDYCLTRDVPLPARLHPIVPEILPRATLKEFYISAVGGDGLSPESVIMAASDYSHRASKYYAEHKEAYDRHIPAAVGRALKACGIAPDPAAMKKVRVERDAFCGSLCAQTVKRRIVVEYYSLARSYRLRQAVTAAVKLAENHVRRAEKIRSRLNTQGTDPALAAAVASYFNAELPPMRKKAEKTAEDTSYERLYDAPTEGIDFTLARELETSSWETTDTLTAEAIPTEPAAEQPPASVPTASDAVPETDSVPFADALRAILAGGTLTAWCKAQPGRMIPAEIAGAINDFAADVLGDVVLEENGGDFILIEEYREDVLSWLTEE